MPNVISKPTNLALRDYTKNERCARIRQSIHWYKVNTKTSKKLYRNLTATHVTFDKPTRMPTSVPSAPPGQPPTPPQLFESSIDERLDTIRKQLAQLRAEWPSPNQPNQPTRPSRPSTPAQGAPQGTPQTSRVNPNTKYPDTGFRMEAFPPRRLRTNSSSSFSVTRRDKALGSNQSDWLPGQRPIGYRPLSGRPCFRSGTAYSFRKKTVNARPSNPYVVDDTPGPGAYNTLVF